MALMLNKFVNSQALQSLAAGTGRMFCSTPCRQPITACINQQKPNTLLSKVKGFLGSSALVQLPVRTTTRGKKL